MEEPRTLTRPRWLRVVPGAAMVAVVIVVATTRWDVLLANNPAFPVTLVVVLLLGLWLVFSGLRPRTPARGGGNRTFLRVLAALGGLGLAAMLLVLRPFPAEQVALDALTSDDSVTVTDTRTSTTFAPAGGEQTGLVLYPGARVDPRAYAVLARDIAAAGSRVVVLKCPFDLALLCTGAADGYLTDEVPWTVGGHSLGGVAASSFAAGSTAVDGIVFWAAYPLSDLSDRDDLAATSIYGTEDGLSKPQDVIGRRDLMPPDVTYVPVEGAVHAFFGSYGPQPGDGEPSVDRDTAQAAIVAATVEALARTTE